MLIRWDSGELRLTLLDAGTVWLDGGAMFGVVPKTLWEREREPDDRNRIRLSMNVLLIEDGVYAAMGGTSMKDKVTDASNRLRFYVLGPDQKARGLREEDVMDCVEVVGYDGFVRLVVGHDATHACL